MKRLIQTVVKNFYQLAVKDFMIGYHFRKIQELPSKEVLYPELEAFSQHIPRITKFWEIQLLGANQDQERPYNLISTHGYLKIRKGELKRFSLLFIETINKERLNNPENSDILDTWIKKIKSFENNFLSSKIIFP